MRCVIVVLLLSVSLAAAKSAAYVFPSPDAYVKLITDKKSRQTRIFEDEVKDILKCVRNIVLHGIPKFHIEPLDPIEFDDETFDLGKIDPNLLKGSLELKAFTIKDFANWDFKTLSIDVTVLPIGAEIKFELINPKLTANGNYKFDAWFLDDHSFGDGTFKSSFADQSLKGYAKVGVKLGKNLMDLSDIEISDFDIDIGLTVDKTNVEITGLMNDEDYSKYVGDYIDKYLNNILQEYKEDFNLAIKNVVEKLLHSLGFMKRDGLIDIIKLICKEAESN